MHHTQNTCKTTCIHYTPHPPPTPPTSTYIHLTSVTFTVSLPTLRSPGAPPTPPSLPHYRNSKFVMWPMPIGSTLFWRSAFITVLFLLLVCPKKTTFIWYLTSMSLMPCTFTPNCSTFCCLALFTSLRKHSLSVSCSDRRLNAFEIFSSGLVQTSSRARSTFPQSEFEKAPVSRQKVLATTRGGDAGLLVEGGVPFDVRKWSWKAKVYSVGHFSHAVNSCAIESLPYKNSKK